MKEHRKHPPALGYPGESGSQVQVDRHGNIRVSLREKEKRKALVRKTEWESHVSGPKPVDDRDSKRFKVQRDKERERTRRLREEERLRAIEAARERDRRLEMKKLEKEKLMRHRIVERDRVARVKRVHEISRDLTPVRSPIRSPKSCSSRSQGEIRARTPSQSPPRSKLRSIVRSAPKSPTPVMQLQSKSSPMLIDQKSNEPIDLLKSNSTVPCDSVGSPDGTSMFDNCESKSEPTIAPVEDMSPISNSSSLGDIDVMEANLTPDKSSLIDDDAKESVKQSEDIVSDENFSDWSEDEDEMLNKPSDKSSPICSMEMPSEESINAPPSDSTEKSSSLLKEIDRIPSIEPSSSSMKPSTADSISIESQDACSSLQDDALESISDDECDAIIGKGEIQESNLNEETSKPKASPLDQEAIEDLDIDWSNLIKQPKPSAPESGSDSARRRMLPGNILSRIGFSHQYAGPQITEKLISYCKQEMKENFIPFRHKVASLHCFIGEQISMREKLFQSNLFSSALSARKDLDIRKILAHTFVDFSHLQSTSPSSESSSPQPTSTLTDNHSSTISTVSVQPCLSINNSLIM